MCAQIVLFWVAIVLRCKHPLKVVRNVPEQCFAEGRQGHVQLRVSVKGFGIATGTSEGDVTRQVFGKEAKAARNF